MRLSQTIQNINNAYPSKYKENVPLRLLSHTKTTLLHFLAEKLSVLTVFLVKP
jgi:hypothetical protein